MNGSYNSYHLVREPDAGKPPVRFDEREVETERYATAPPLDSTDALFLASRQARRKRSRLILDYTKDAADW